MVVARPLRAALIFGALVTVIFVFSQFRESGVGSGGWSFGPERPPIREHADGVDPNWDCE